MTDKMSKETKEFSEKFRTLLKEYNIEGILIMEENSGKTGLLKAFKIGHFEGDAILLMRYTETNREE